MRKDSGTCDRNKYLNLSKLIFCYIISLLAMASSIMVSEPYLQIHFGKYDYYHTHGNFDSGSVKFSVCNFF